MSSALEVFFNRNVLHKSTFYLLIYLLTFCVCDLRLITVLSMQVLVNDVNDSPPVFSATSPLRLSIPETTVPGDQMATFQLPVATDADGPANNVVSYRLQPETDSSLDYFRLSLVNSSATEITEVRLLVVSALDREAMSEHRLMLVAYDGGVPALSTSLLVIVNVDDANDNRPVFDRPEYDVTLPETSQVGTEVAVLLAVDADVGANGRVTYRFSERGRGREDFRLDERSGVVVVGRRLDFARQSEYRLGVLAEDGGVGGLASFAMLTVSLLDENDHAPVIDVHTAAGDSGSVTVDLPRRGSTAAVDRFVAHVSVTDDDGGDNGRVMCWLNASRVEVTEHPVTDHLRRSEPSTTVAPPSDVSSNLDRNQSNVTTMAAAFDLVWLYEDEYKIQLTTNVSATQDGMDNVGYDVIVTCRDHGLPVAMTSSAAIHVTIHHDDSLPSIAAATPEGNIGPRFVFPAPGNDTVYVKTGLPVGHVVAIVRAAGSGNDVALSYELVDGNGSTYFDVDRTSGHVVTAVPLPVDNATTLKLIVGVGGTSGDRNVSMFSLAELYVVTWTGSPLPVATTVTSVPGGSKGLGQWSLWLVGQNLSSVALVVVVSCSLVLGAVIFAGIFLVCRKSRRTDWLSLRRPQCGSRKLTSSYHVAVEFTASDDGLNNIAMATASHAPATSLIGILYFKSYIHCRYQPTCQWRF